MAAHAKTRPIEIPREHKSCNVSLGNRTVHLTNLVKPFWPELGITKRDLLRYYADVSDVLLPHIRDRAMVMKRCPNGAAGEFFFMKRAPEPRPEWIRICSIEHASGDSVDFTIWTDRKGRDMDYRSGERGAGMLKIKFKRTADCVVGGFRYAERAPVVGWLLLGLYDDAGVLHHVGNQSGGKAGADEEAREVDRASRCHGARAGRAEPVINGPVGGPGSRSRRSSLWKSSTTTGGRFRHGTRFVRWRPDKAPRQCTMAQVERETQSPVGLLKIPA